MTTYTCPTCNETLPREILLFIEHTDIHIRQVQDNIDMQKLERQQWFKVPQLRLKDLFYFPRLNLQLPDAVRDYRTQSGREALAD